MVINKNHDCFFGDYSLMPYQLSRVNNTKWIYIYIYIYIVIHRQTVSLCHNSSVLAAVFYLSMFDKITKTHFLYIILFGTFQVSW